MKTKKDIVCGADVEEVFRDRGVRLTPQRLLIWRELIRHSTHPGAEEIFKAVRRRLPTLSLDTVYRTLHLFSSLGLIEPIGSDRQRARFDADTTPHHHFVCEQCGAIFDVPSDEADRLQNFPTQVSCGRVERVRVEFRGICKKCSETEGPYRPKST